MPIGSNEGWFTWDRSTILTYAPNSSGVYAIFNGQSWIYVGESGDVQARLLQHWNIDIRCINQNVSTGFQFELVAGQAARVARQNQWIAALRPLCNQRLG